MSFKRAVLLVLAVLLMPGLALAQTQTRATFTVLKDFTDDNPAEVNFTIDCTTGLIIEQEQTTFEGQTPALEFVVIEFTSGQMSCSVTEDVPANYSVSYAASGDSTAVSDNTAPDLACRFSEIADGDANTCVVTNTPNPAAITITKTWMINDDEDQLNGISAGYSIELECDAEEVEILSAPGGSIDNANGDVNWSFNDDEPTDRVLTASVRPLVFGADENCDVRENVFDSAVEVQNTCSSDFDIVAGGSRSCALTNTVFFEGIPTLNQYGLAVLALVMLGVGFVGFRRFA